jgi:hypothetical protein
MANEDIYVKSHHTESTIYILDIVSKVNWQRKSFIWNSCQVEEMPTQVFMYSMTTFLPDPAHYPIM